MLIHYQSCHTDTLPKNWREIYMRKLIKRPEAEMVPNATEETSPSTEQSDLITTIKERLGLTPSDPEGAPQPATIRHGVKSERDTQPVQVRMLRAQVKVLKQVAEQEGRNSSDVIRDLVDAYIAHCLTHWPEGDRLDILRATVRANGYHAEHHPKAERVLAWLSGEKYKAPYGAEQKPDWISDEEWAKQLEEFDKPRDTRSR